MEARPGKVIGTKQGSKGIKQLMYIFNDDTQNYPFCRLQIGGGNVTTLNLLNQPIKFY